MFFKILNNERGQQVHESYINGFFEKILVRHKWSMMGLEMKHPHNWIHLKDFLKFASIKKDTLISPKPFYCFF